jgi:hypothetical protein
MEPWGYNYVDELDWLLYNFTKCADEAQRLDGVGREMALHDLYATMQAAYSLIQAIPNPITMFYLKKFEEVARNARVPVQVPNVYEDDLFTHEGPRNPL